MRAVGPGDLVTFNQPPKDFVDHLRRLQRRAVPGDIRPGHAAQFAVDQRHQLFQSRSIAVAPGLEQLGEGW